MRQTKRSFVERIDFRTSPGNLGGSDDAASVRAAQGWSGRGPSVVVTDLGVYHFDDDGEMRLDSLHPGASVDGVGAAMGWTVRVSSGLSTTPPPSAEELHLIREVLDPEGRYTG
jgi:glutaconate CoA-transferase subunit B